MKLPVIRNTNNQGELIYMDGPCVKNSFVGFKCTPELRSRLFDIAKVNGVTVSKFICFLLMQFLDMPVPLQYQSWILPDQDLYDEFTEVLGNE